MNTDRANNLLSHIRSFGVQWGEESAEIVKSADHSIQEIQYFPEWLGGGVCFNGQHHINTADSHNYLSAHEGRAFRSVYIESIPCARPKNLWVGESYQPFINWEI